MDELVPAAPSRSRVSAVASRRPSGCTFQALPGRATPHPRRRAGDRLRLASIHETSPSRYPANTWIRPPTAFRGFDPAGTAQPQCPKALAPRQRSHDNQHGRCRGHPLWWTVCAWEPRNAAFYLLNVELNRYAVVATADVASPSHGLVCASTSLACDVALPVPGRAQSC